MTTIERASAATGYKLADLRGPSRDPKLCRARFAVMYAMRAHGSSLPAIGRTLRRHHTTILSGLVRADHYAVNDPAFMDLVEALA